MSCHAHRHCCEHSLHVCPHCDRVYCSKCGREWSPTWGYVWPQWKPTWVWTPYTTCGDSYTISSDDNVAMYNNEGTGGCCHK